MVMGLVFGMSLANHSDSFLSGGACSAKMDADASEKDSGKCPFLIFPELS